MAVKQYSYWMQLRPPGPGAQPMDGMIQCNNREIWYNGSHYWGEVIYNRVGSVTPELLESLYEQAK